MSGPERTAATGELVGAYAPAAAGSTHSMELQKMQTHTDTKPGRVQIGDVDLDQIFYRGEPVVTLAQIDKAHKRPDDTAGRNFRANKSARFTEGVDFVTLDQPDEIRRLGFTRPQGGTAASVTLITRRGYLKLVKSLNDDLAWSVFDDMIERYFAVEVRQQIPNFSDPAAAARAWAAEYEARQVAERTKAEIGSRREATAMNTASQAVKTVNSLKIVLDQSQQYATVKRMEMLFHGQQFNWRLLKRTAIEMGIPPKDVFDANYGKVNAYHADVWREAYALDIPSGPGDVA